MLDESLSEGREITGSVDCQAGRGEVLVLVLSLHWQPGTVQDRI